MALTERTKAPSKGPSLELTRCAKTSATRRGLPLWMSMVVSIAIWKYGEEEIHLTIVMSIGAATAL
jgi:hypothetical protein